MTLSPLCDHRIGPKSKSDFMIEWCLPRSQLPVPAAASLTPPFWGCLQHDHRPSPESPHSPPRIFLDSSGALSAVGVPVGIHTYLTVQGQMPDLEKA